MINHLFFIINLINNNIPIARITRPRTVVNCIPKTGIYANSGKNLGCTYPIPSSTKPTKARIIPNIIIFNNIINKQLFLLKVLLNNKCIRGGG